MEKRPESEPAMAAQARGADAHAARGETPLRCSVPMMHGRGQAWLDGCRPIH